MIFLLTTCDKSSDEPAQVCILKSSIDGSGMSSITAFMLNGFILYLTTKTATWKKALLYISLYKQTNLANLLSCLTLWFAWLFFFKKSSNIYCYFQMFNFDDQAAYDLSPSW